MNSIDNETTEKIEKNFNFLNCMHYLYNENYKESSLDKNDNNILIKFVLDNNIISTNKQYLTNFIFELDNFISNENNNIILPFLEPTTSLVQSYINSDLDETDTSYKNIKIFQKLINNSFINRENLVPIFSFFSDLYSNIKNMSQEDPKLKKISKIIELMKIFYNFNMEDSNKEFLNSSICFIGGSLTLLFKKKISFENQSICIRINLFHNNYMHLIDKEKSFLKIDNNTIITYKDIENNISKHKIEFLTIIIEPKNIIICFDENSPKKEVINDDINISKFIKFYSKNSNFTEKKIDIPKLKEIIFLDNFFGQVTLIRFSIIKDNHHLDNINHYLYKPISETNNGYFKMENDCINNIITRFENNKIPIVELKITDIKFAKVNYVNYCDKDFPIVDYFGGIVQFLPFAYIIKQFYINEKITTICNKSKNYFLLTIVDNILFIIMKCLLRRKYSEELIQKYYLFGFCILTELVYVNIEYQKNHKTEQENLEFISNLYILQNIFKIDINENLMNFYVKITNAFRGEQFESNIKNLIVNAIGIEKKNIKNSNLNNNKTNLFVLEKTYSQLYKKLMKELFIYNRMWSQKNLFFDFDNNEIQNKKTIKYKQINHYTKNFQQPLLYPILEISNYYPNFSQFTVDKLYKNPNEEILDYDFSLSDKDEGIFAINNKISNSIEKYNLKKIKESENEKCCLIKKTHHVKGCMSILEKEKNSIPKFELIFISNKNDINETCNKEIQEEEKNNTNDENVINRSSKHNINICYGSIFSCPKKDYGKKLVIKSKNILFIIIREYYYRVSAIEIFTINNKSYLFNFNNAFFNIKDISKDYTNCNFNKILEKISKHFTKIEIKQEKTILLGFYNNTHEKYLYPLFSENMNKWNKKNKLYSNYDKLAIINLFSNRSFNDLHQYPIFPMFYKNILYKDRDMGTHIGLLEINSASANRKKLFLDSYNTTKTEIENGESNEELYLFTTHYSNPIFTCNYLIRIFPYSLISIEFQGNGFDNANRLFYSLPNICNNTLSHKSDLRETIPEMFYLPELFENSNKLQFYKIYNGEEIDNVKFTNDEINDNKNNYNKIPANLHKYLYLLENRDLLEKEKTINLWINLIFGKDQKEREDENLKISQKYFEESSFVKLENNSEYYNNFLVMQSVDFGLEPFQLFKENFPNPINYNDNYNIKSKIKEKYKNGFVEEHIENFNDPYHCFICKIRPIVSQSILKLFENDGMDLMNKTNIKDQKNNSLFKGKVYEIIFVGDVFGSVTIYERIKNIKKIIDNKAQESKYSATDFGKSKKKNSMPNKKNINDIGSIGLEIDNNEEECKYKQLMQLNDHFKEIKYIDYNPRLNLFITYSLDGYLNIYTFPDIKMVRVINVEKYTKKNELKKVALLSNPFAMIFCYNKENYFFFSINGEIIKKEKVNKGEEFYPCIDKYLGLFKDFVEMRKKRENSSSIESKNIFLSFH